MPDTAMEPSEDAALRPGPVIDAGGIFLVVVTVCVFMLPILIYFPPLPPSKSEALLQTHSLVGCDGPPRSSWPGWWRWGLRKPAVPQQGRQNPARIASLWIYPVKSCQGIEIGRSKVLPTGLEFDRLYTFAQLKSPFPVGLDTSDAEKSQHRWEFATQRQFPRLATVQVDLFVPNVAKARGQDAPSADAFIILRFPWTERGLAGTLSWLVAKLARG